MPVEGSHSFSHLKRAYTSKSENKVTSKVEDILVKVPAEKSNEVTAKMQEMQKYVSDIVREGNQMQLQTFSIQHSLDGIKIAMEQLKEITGESEETIITAVFHDYYAAGNLTLKDMVNAAKSVQFARIPADDKGCILLLNSFHSYLEQAGSDHSALEVARTQLISISEAATCPVSIEKCLCNDGMNTTYITTKGHIFSLQQQPEYSVMVSDVNKMLNFGVVLNTQFAISADEVGVQIENVNESPVFVQGTVTYDMDSLKKNNPGLYNHLQGLLTQVIWNLDGSINRDKTDVDVLNELHAFLGTAQFKRQQN